jgi:uncharacterized membrane protein YedE/YeeE
VADVNLIGGLIGGALIGLGSLALLAFGGRIAGISGILGGLLGKWNDVVDKIWRLIFLTGLISGAGLVAWIKGGLEITLEAHGFLLAFAGILVGFGTRLGSGCTSGHGVCGIARRSKRSIFATVSFILVAIITVFITRHIM